MAKEIKQLAISNPLADTNTLIFSFTQPVGELNSGLFLSNAILTNKSIEDARFDLWMVNPSASTNFGYIAKSLILPAKDVFETSKFTMKIGDLLYARVNSASVSIVVSGINQTEAV